MSKDFIKKEPTKNERMLFELAMAQQQMERGLWSTSTVVMALGILTKVKPEEIAKLMLDEKVVKEFSDKVNVEIKKLEAEKHGHGHEEHDRAMEEAK